MKKTITVLFAAAAIMLCGCGANVNENKTPEQAKTEARISELEELIKNSVVISDIKTDTVHLGTSVTVLDLEFNEEFTYDIVGSTEADPMKNRISDLSPIGSALIGKKVGEEAVAATPNGELKFKILGIAKTEEE